MIFKIKLLDLIKRGKTMDIIKKLFCFNDDDNSAIGLCKFSDDFFKLAESSEKIKQKIKKEVTLTQMLRKNI